MDITMEKELNALGGLFQTVVLDMKSNSPLWEDFTAKSAKLHNNLKITIQAIGAFLDSFQKLADAATNTRGATRDIGSALTRLCLRHKSIEKKLNEFNTALLKQMVIPLNERIEEWKKNVVTLDKDHQKEYKKARANIKKASSDTLRLAKKARKGKSDAQIKLDSAKCEVNSKFSHLEEVERKFCRDALIQERGRFCDFIGALKPVVDHEVDMLTEVTHLQEIIHWLCLQASEPQQLPQASEQVILDLKGADYSISNFPQRNTPPSSPSSLGSRKSSMCSISSINSSASGGSTNSPSHHPAARNRPPSQPLPPGCVRLSSVSSQDSGFTSQDTLFLKPPSPHPNQSELFHQRKSSLQDSGSGSSGGSTPSPQLAGGASSSSSSSWSSWSGSDPSTTGPAGTTPGGDSSSSHQQRPHTISTAYEKSHHSRPALSAATFTTPPHTAPATPNPYAAPTLMRPASVGGSPSVPPLPGPKPRQSKAVAPPVVPGFAATPTTPTPAREGTDGELPIYVNQNDLASLSGAKPALDEVNEEDEDDDDEATTPTPNRNQDIVAIATAAAAGGAAGGGEAPCDLFSDDQPAAPASDNSKATHAAKQQDNKFHFPDSVSMTTTTTQNGRRRRLSNTKNSSLFTSQEEEEKEEQNAFDIGRIIAELDQTTAALQTELDIESSNTLKRRPSKTKSLKYGKADAVTVAYSLSTHAAAATGDVCAADDDVVALETNSNELADALRELEASTAALELVYASGSGNSESSSSGGGAGEAGNRSSLQCSSGYGTMTNTPACSQDTIATTANATTYESVTTSTPPTPTSDSLPSPTLPPPPPDTLESSVSDDVTTEDDLPPPPPPDHPQSSDVERSNTPYTSQPATPVSTHPPAQTQAKHVVVNYATLPTRGGGGGGGGGGGSGGGATGEGRRENNNNNSSSSSSLSLYPGVTIRAGSHNNGSTCGGGGHQSLQRPVSTAGIPCTTASSVGGIVRRGSMHNIPKPPPPIRRTPSMPAGAPAYLRYSGGATSEPEYADPQEIMSVKSAMATTGAVYSAAGGMVSVAGGQPCPQMLPVYMTPHLVVPSLGGHVECLVPGSGVETITLTTTSTTMTSQSVPPPTQQPPPPPTVPTESPSKAQEQLYAQPHIPGSSQDDFDLPPPPPPEELEADMIYAKTLVTQSTATSNGAANNTDSIAAGDIIRQKDPSASAMGLPERRKMGSVVETHAGIIANLNARFTATGGSTPNSPPVVLGKPPLAPPNFCHQPPRSLSPGSEESDTTPTADNQPPTPGGGMLTQIQRGMSLRRTVTNDRSAPKLN